MWPRPDPQLFTSVGVAHLRRLSGGAVDQHGTALLLKQHAVGVVGLACDGYAHLDVTPTRVAGVEHECHVLGNTAFVFYHTDLYRDRQAALRTLQLGATSTFQVNDAAWTFLGLGATAGGEHAGGPGDGVAGPALQPGGVVGRGWTRTCPGWDPSNGNGSRMLQRSAPITPRRRSPSWTPWSATTRPPSKG